MAYRSRSRGRSYRRGRRGRGKTKQHRTYFVARGGVRL